MGQGIGPHSTAVGPWRHNNLVKTARPSWFAVEERHGIVAQGVPSCDRQPRRNDYSPDASSGETFDATLWNLCDRDGSAGSRAVAFGSCSGAGEHVADPVVDDAGGARGSDGAT